MGSVSELNPGKIDFGSRARARFELSRVRVMSLIGSRLYIVQAARRILQQPHVIN